MAESELMFDNMKAFECSVTFAPEEETDAEERHEIERGPPVIFVRWHHHVGIIGRGE